MPTVPALLGAPLHAQVLGVRPLPGPLLWWATPSLAMRVGE